MRGRDLPQAIAVGTIHTSLRAQVRAASSREQASSVSTVHASDAENGSASPSVRR